MIKVKVSQDANHLHYSAEGHAMPGEGKDSRGDSLEHHRVCASMSVLGALLLANGEGANEHGVFSVTMPNNDRSRMLLGAVLDMVKKVDSAYPGYIGIQDEYV